MDQNLCRRHMPHPKRGCSRGTTAVAAPATFCLVHLQVIGREQMAIAADTVYGYGFGDTFQRKAHHISFGCSKACPRYHLQRVRSGYMGDPLPERAWFAPLRIGLPSGAAPLPSPRPDDRVLPPPSASQGLRAAPKGLTDPSQWVRRCAPSKSPSCTARLLTGGRACWP